MLNGSETIKRVRAAQSPEEIAAVLERRARAGVLPPPPRRGYFKRYTQRALSAMQGAGLE